MWSYSFFFSFEKAYLCMLPFGIPSGVGLAAIQLTREAGAIPYVTASILKHQYALAAGAEATIDYKTGIRLTFTSFSIG